MPRHGLLDPFCREFFDAKSRRGRDEQHDGRGVAHEIAGSRVVVMRVELLDGADLGLVLVDEQIELRFELDEWRRGDLT